MSHSVQVSNIASTTTKETLHDFFTFCGKISSIELKEDGATKHAIVSFEKPTAAKTALMLNGGTLDGSNITVASDTEHQDEPHSPTTDSSSHPIDQTDKPRAGIAAEYLAKGYKLSDPILERAIALDKERGISAKFLSYLKNLDETVGKKALGEGHTVSGHVKSVDESKGISKTAWDYYARAINSPLGQKVYAFYSQTSKQALDIHEEARRIADEQKKAASEGTSTAPTTSTTTTTTA